MNDFTNYKSIILDLGFDENRYDQLIKYIESLWVANVDLNLFSRQTTAKDLMENHVIDCLLALKYFPKNLKHVADFGTGGGLPAIVYALQFPEVHFNLYEKSPLKQNFLTQCRTEISNNLHVHSFVHDRLERIDLVTARGFKPIDVIIQMSEQYYKNGGKYFLLKGRLEKINEEIQATQKKHKNFKAEIIPLKSPVLDVERHLVSINH